MELGSTGYSAVTEYFYNDIGMTGSASPEKLVTAGQVASALKRDDTYGFPVASSDEEASWGATEFMSRH